MSATHGATCGPECQLSAVPSPLDRVRPPGSPCPYCGADAGVACTTLNRRRPMRLTVFGPCHPSRIEVAA
ncbi:zinc finger domain-containing protein [Nocardioides sp. Iso805N]|uniref:zinc finger domain-containing protein n=1 Tax=Nocardioides sp. Iso805N TaxID=1283287 RepID=UPI003FA42230